MRAEASAHEKRREFAWLALLLVIVIGVRVFALGADPLPDTEGGFITDWGDWSRNARTHALWGSWIVDDYNLGLSGAFGFTMAVRLMFGLFGVGQLQTNLVNVIGGVAIVLVVYGVVRSFAGHRTALLAGVLQGINPITIIHDRSGYPETFQLLFLVLAVAGIFSSRDWLVALGGASCALAVVAKVTGMVFLPIVAMIWISQWVAGRYLGLEDRFAWRRLFLYGTVAAAVLLIYGLGFVLPHRSDIGLEITQSSGGFFTPVGRGVRPDRVSLFGFSRLGFRLNGFFRLQWYLVIIAALFAGSRITRTLRAPVTRLEVACWTWLVAGGLYLALLFYQPDRRFLFLVPPLAILGALLLGRELVLGPTRWSGRLRGIAFAVAGALIGGFAAFHFVRYYGPYRVMSLSERLGHPLSYSAAAGFLVTAAAVVAAISAPAAAGQRRIVSFHQQWVIVPLIAGGVTALWTYQMVHRSYSIHRVEATVARLTETWPARERVAVGGAASTFVVRTRVLGVSYEWKGPPATERFHPPLAIALQRSSLPFEPVLKAMLAGPPQKVDCAQLSVWPMADGTPRFVVHLLVEPHRVERCKAAVAETAFIH